MTKLEKFLISLSDDAKVKDSYLSDPHKAMSNAGLTREEMVLILSGNTEAIEKAIGKAVDSLWDSSTLA